MLRSEHSLAPSSLLWLPSPSFPSFPGPFIFLLLLLQHLPSLFFFPPISLGNGDKLKCSSPSWLTGSLGLRCLSEGDERAGGSFGFPGDLGWLWQGAQSWLRSRGASHGMRAGCSPCGQHLPDVSQGSCDSPGWHWELQVVAGAWRMLLFPAPASQIAHLF